MIDLHAHILPGVDDGAANLEESLAMARLALADGVRTIVATPHSVERQPAQDSADIRARVAQLQAALDQAGLAVRLVPGMEVYVAPDLAQQAERGQVLCLGDTSYVLVELPLHQYPAYTEQAIFELQVKGYMPVLAHPERNALLAHEPERLYRMVERGVISQITAGSLVGDFGRQARAAAVLFVGHGLAHVIASDAHGLCGAALSRGVAVAASVVGQEQAQAMVTDVPATILAGERLALEPPVPLKPGRGWPWQL